MAFGRKRLEKTNIQVGSALDLTNVYPESFGHGCVNFAIAKDDQDLEKSHSVFS